MEIFDRRQVFLIDDKKLHTCMVHLRLYFSVGAFDFC